jgi:hypothetical protein
MLCGFADGKGATTGVMTRGDKSCEETLIFASSTGAWEHPKTVQPPFSATHAA